MHFLGLFLQNHLDPAVAPQMMMAMFGVFMIIGLVMIVVVAIPFFFILKKAGFSPWLCLVCLVPSLGVLVLLYVLAFADWKVVPAPATGWVPQPPYPPQPPLPPQV